MRNFKIFIAALLLLCINSFVLFGCDNNNNGDTQTAENNETADIADSTQDTNHTEKLPEETELEPYLQNLVKYFHYPRKAGEAPAYDGVLALVADFCYNNIDNLKFVNFDEITSRITVNGTDFRKVSKNLLGENFDIEEFHTYFTENTEDQYNEKEDIYTFTVGQNRTVDTGYSIDTEKSPIISETDSSVTAAVSVLWHGDGTLDFLYCFEKISDGDITYYRIGDVYWNLDTVIKSTWNYKTEVSELTDYADDAEKYTISMELPYYMRKSILDPRTDSDAIMLFDYIDGSYSDETTFSSQMPGFGIIGIYKVESNFVFDETIAEKVNNHLKDNEGDFPDGRVNHLVEYLDDSHYDMIVGKTNSGNDYILCAASDADDVSYLTAYGYVRISDEEIVCLSLFRDSMIHREDIIEAVKTLMFIR